MDEDLKIVITSELEADEKASAQRISAQLPNIAKLINSKSSIKVGVELVNPDVATMKNQAQKISSQLSKAASVDVGVSLHVTRDAKQMLRNALKEVGDSGVDSKITAAMTKNLDDMQVKVKNIEATWVKVKDTKEKLLQLSISGVTQDQQDVTILQQYDESGKKVLETTKNLSLNLEKIEQQERRAAAQAQKDNESRVSYLNQQQILLDDIHSKYLDPNGAKPIVYVEDIEQLNQEYNKIYNTIKSLESTQGKLGTQAKDDLDKQIAGYKELARSIQNAEYVATSLRTKTTRDVNAEQVEKLAEYENKLRSSGKLTETFQRRISELRKTLSSAFDSSSLTAYLNQFDKLKSEVGSFDSQLSAVNAGFTKLAEYESKITSIRKAMLKTPSDSDEYNGLRNQLAFQLDLQKEISAEIGKQIAKNPELLQYASAYNQLLFVRKDCEAQIAIEEGRVADAANAVSASMESIPAVVQNIETRFRNLKDAPTELVQKIQSLTTLMNAVSNANGDKVKVEAYQKLQEAIKGCNQEITQLLGVQNGNIRSFVDTEKLEKAKADLTTIGRQWSALKGDPGLNQQFNTLSNNLKVVERGEMSLRQWTAQFARFKAEVKAAGKNMQSLGDILKNNVGKVLQWVSATTLLFRAFRLLKTAGSTIVGLNTAMIDLQKVTTATREEYDRFYRSANDTAKALGVTTEEVISQTAEWARLGYAMNDAAKLAKNSAIFEAISPGMDIEDATDGLVSVIKAYGVAAEDSLDGIISKINDIGNKFAVSNKNIVEVMTRASSAMSAANNTFEETVALATAAIEITRDATTVGKYLPNTAVMQYEKVAISVKGQRWFRPSKDFVIYIITPVGSWCDFFVLLHIDRKECVETVTLYMVTCIVSPLSYLNRMKIQSGLTK